MAGVLFPIWCFIFAITSWAFPAAGGVWSGHLLQIHLGAQIVHRNSGSALCQGLCFFLKSNSVCLLQVFYFPSGASSLLSHPGPFLLLAVCGLVTSFTSTLMFTAMGSFFNRISDPGMGGAYLTLLNTIANMGKQFCRILCTCQLQKMPRLFSPKGPAILKSRLYLTLLNAIVNMGKQFISMPLMF